MQNARNSLCRKQWIIFVGKQWTILLNVEIKFIFWIKISIFYNASI